MVLEESYGTGLNEYCKFIESNDMKVFFPHDLQALQQALGERKLHPRLDRALQDSHYSMLLIMAHINKVVMVSHDAVFVAQMFYFWVQDAISWLASECSSRGLRSFGVQILEEVRVVSAKICFELRSMECDGIAEVLTLLESGTDTLMKQMVGLLSEDLVDAAIISPDRVKIILNSYSQFLDRTFIHDSLCPTILSTYKQRQEVYEKIPCVAQVLANLGTGFISHKPSYAYGHTHVSLAQLFFEEAEKRLPSQVCAKQSDHLRKNIRISRLVPGVLHVFRAINSADSSDYFLKDFFGNDSDIKDICSAIKFVLQITVDGRNPHGVQGVVCMLRRLSTTFPELSNKCMEWVAAAS